MRLHNPFLDFAYDDLFSALLPDFVLSFAFFTAMIYAVLGKRFGQQRPAITIAAALGAALSIGLVWWEQVNDLSIRNLGPIAAGFAIIVLAGVIYQSIRGMGGNWAGAGIAIGACLLVGWIVGIDWPVDRGAVQAVMTVALTVGVIAFLLHRRGFHPHGFSFRSQPAPQEFKDVQHDMRDLDDDRHVAGRMSKGFRRLRREAKALHEHPEDASDIMLQLRRMLPAEGWLTERLARLCEKAHLMQRGHIARIEEIRGDISRLPPQAKRKAASELSARYRELKLDLRIERLDKAAAVNERRVRELTKQAEAYLAEHNHKKLVDVLNDAKKLQGHNARLLKTISRTEARLLTAAKQIAKRPQEVRGA
ncbi:MAG: hypothetical protein JXQ75_08850 [Phycisphaerae bacterium]|nr:hypothetical protein [Phycisphaerae bacterium]